ncbi:MAG TPA: hypothetical protein VNX68_15640, partial [Nitrosopumilaceae archaeon]|nr:hypothetical protein [Nitrosopumilaceae archaeon]
DHDIFQELGHIGFNNVLGDIPKLCKEYLKLLNSTKMRGEVGFIRDEYPEHYSSIIDSLTKISTLKSANK